MRQPFFAACLPAGEEERESGCKIGLITWRSLRAGEEEKETKRQQVMGGQ